MSSSSKTTTLGILIAATAALTLAGALSDGPAHAAATHADPAHAARARLGGRARGAGAEELTAARWLRAHAAMANHSGWPPLSGMLLENRRGGDRPLDGRPGHDPFDGADPTYSCDEITTYTGCGGGSHFTPYAHNPEANLVPASVAHEHNMLLGGNGNDTIHAGPDGDVIWGDFEPGQQPESQVDYLFGGPGNDWIYASYGTNYIWTGAGDDHVALVYGHGVVHCGPGHKTLVMRKLPQNRHYALIGCTDVTIVAYAA